MEKQLIFGIINSLIRVKIFGQRVPLTVGWVLSYRCNRRCIYCGAWSSDWPELDTMANLRIADELKKLGTRWISLTGGEPLLRDDIGQIVEHLRKLGMRVSINTNGSLVSKKTKELKNVSMVKLSLDGPEDVHDMIRGKGSFREVMEAIEACKENQIPVGLQCVLSSFNVECVDYLAQMAMKKNIYVNFQPATLTLLRSKEINTISVSGDGYRNAIEKIIGLKKKGLPIDNSIPGLKYLKNWPNLEAIDCSAGRLSLRIEPDGTVLGCDRFMLPVPGALKKKKDIKQQLLNIQDVKKCKNCACGLRVEFNLLCQLNLSAALNCLKNEKRFR